MQNVTDIHQDGQEKQRTVIRPGRAKVPFQETVRLTRSDKARSDELFERFKKSEEYSRSVFMRYIFHLGLEAAEKETRPPYMMRQ